MPDTITRFTIFVSSPSDFYAQHRVAEEAAQRMNENIIDDGFMFRVQYAKKARPGVGHNSAQEVIDAQFNNYDIYLGLMGSRFGSEVDGFGSGTEKEYHLALSRHDRDPESTKIWFFFFPPNNLSSINMDQLSKVKAFQDRLGGRVLYREITTEEFIKTFEDLLRDYIREYKKKAERQF